MKLARDALPLVAVLVLVTAALGLFLHVAAAVPTALFLLFTLWFFRDPERSPPEDAHALISPADGRIIKAGPDKISVFMNVFNVHVCRSPVSGVVQRVDHEPGKFLAAYRDEASDHNERLRIELDDGTRRSSFTLIAGLIARRIVCSVAPGERLAAGQRIGLIRFGSRVDLELPADGEVAVGIGQRVVAGETVLARVPAPASDVPLPAPSRR
jgi:phosphatidylserine decarboxylase